MGTLSTSQRLQIQKTQFISAQELSFHLKKQSLYSSQVFKNNISQRDQFLRKVIPFTNSSQAITQYLSILQNIGRNIHCDNLLLPIICNIVGQQATCNDFRKLEICLQNYDVNITNEIAARKKQRQMFAETEIWYIIYSILNGCRIFEKFGISSGFLKTQNILLNGKGHVKIINRLTAPPAKEYSHLQLPNFYSPEEIRVMKESVHKFVNPNISQTYSIGIIALQLCTFINGQLFYDMNNLRIDQKLLRRAQQIISNKYSKLLVNLIKTMLSNAYDRPLPSQIFSAFKPYQKYILTLRPFKFDVKNLNNNLNNSTATL